MYITNIDYIPLWAWGINTEDINDLQKTEIKFGEEYDLLCDPDFLYENYSY